MHSERECRHHHCAALIGARHFRDGGNPLMLAGAAHRKIKHDLNTAFSDRFLTTHARTTRVNETRK